jgi:hypothetical protein
MNHVPVTEMRNKVKAGTVQYPLIERTGTQLTYNSNTRLLVQLAAILLVRIFSVLCTNSLILLYLSTVTTFMAVLGF